MPRTTINFGTIFIILGLYAYFGISSESITALIPAFLGIPLLILGKIAQNEKYLKHAMHGATVLVLAGFIGSVNGLFKFFRMLGGEEFERTAAIKVQAIMALLCIIFLVLAIKSFIDARKNR